jgi:hypothetical protein
MNQRLILNFVNYCFSEGIGENRALKYLSTLKIVSKSIYIDLDKAAEADIRAYVGSIERSSLSDWIHGELCCPEIISLQDSSQIFTSELLIFATEPKKTVLEILVISLFNNPLFIPHNHNPGFYQVGLYNCLQEKRFLE